MHIENNLYFYIKYFAIKQIKGIIIFDARPSGVTF